MMSFWRGIIPASRQDVMILTCSSIGLLLGVAGLISWIAAGFYDTVSLICLIAGTVMFFGFRKIASIRAKHRKEDQEEP